MEYTITMADVCELAHELLVREAKQKGFEVSDEETYTPKEQDIFDKYYDIITNILKI